ncbi:hypothetical protein TNIN_436461 [Trichonephila inaurata madagascariensis]|uniref:Uncharacterized protein n=1 Tax=Trichonephila inaurata madagascariensis TaxID=2747483 RepID=A0A8X7CIM7_9ARAC|nr:hypothetical protein TNIN_436461 [Trichonephila inaurata madagascariensis]
MNTFISLKEEWKVANVRYQSRRGWTSAYGSSEGVLLPYHNPKEDTMPAFPCPPSGDVPSSSYQASPRETPQYRPGVANSRHGGVVTMALEWLKSKGKNPDKLIVRKYDFKLSRLSTALNKRRKMVECGKAKAMVSRQGSPNRHGGDTA